MRNVFLILIFAFIAKIGVAQEIPEKANTIVITLPDSNSAKEKVLKIFESKDYKVKSNSNSKITTVPKTIKGNTRVGLNAELKGTEVYLTGYISLAAQSAMRIEHKGKKDTPIMNAWEEMDKVAKAFKGQVKYEVK